jgi:23S rRNA pseudouridine1911/1915/1917 synthase
VTSSAPIRRVIVPADASPQRLDVYLAAALGRSRSQVERLLRAGFVAVGSTQARGSYLVQPGDELVVSEPAPVPTKTAPELPIVYDDADLFVVDKPAGLAVHPANLLAHSPTVADFARIHSSDPDPERPGIVHRLDRDTSGLLIIAKTATAKVALQNQFRQRAIAKTYQALVIGAPNPRAAIINLALERDRNHPLRRTVAAAGKPAVTAYRTLMDYPGFSLLELKPQTGRTHQLRVHLAAIGHPIAGDTTYGPPRRPLGLKRQFLHAAELEFVTLAGKTLHLKSPLAPDLAAVLQRLENQV